MCIRDSIPCGPDIQYAEEQPDAPIELRIFPGQDGSFEYYEDEGDNYNYEQGLYALTPIQWLDKERQLIFAERRGSYPGMQEQREFVVKIISKISEKIDITEPQKVVYVGNRIVVDF